MRPAHRIENPTAIDEVKGMALPSIACARITGSAVLALALSAALFLPAYGQSSGDPRLETGWKFDRIALATGKTIDGLILADDGVTGMEFMEVRRLPGKPMNLVVRPIERRMIASVESLNDAERKILRGRLDRFMHRAKFEARRMDDIKLSSQTRDEGRQWNYHGNWFWLESTADEQTSRRAAVRIEQIFTAYRQLLPPQRSPQRHLKIMLFGAEPQYAAFLRGLGLEIANPAFFAADFNIVAAGSDINRFNEQLATTRAEHKAVKDRLDAEFAQLPARLAALAEQMRRKGIAASERKAVIAAEQRRQQERREKLLDDIAQADRRNANKFLQVTDDMYSRLYHEAFHAYLDNYVYPHHEFDVPRWLNEGLALTFEGGQLESDTLRIDAPNRRALRALHADLRGPNPLPLSELLSADADAFLPAHRGGDTAAARLYAYSWGLAYHLTFERSLLDSAAFAEFISPASGKQPAIKRLEHLVGEPLDVFESKWRTAMLKLH